MKDLEHYYRVLDLEPGASLEEVNQAYKDLVFVWHPDRIPTDNERLHQKAQEKIKEINQARDRLRTFLKSNAGANATPNPSAQSTSSARPEPSRPSYSRARYR
ncbi:J domain-containing protein, partial [Thermoleptolyngbya sp.]